MRCDSFCGSICTLTAEGKSYSYNEIVGEGKVVAAFPSPTISPRRERESMYQDPSQWKGPLSDFEYRPPGEWSDIVDSYQEKLNRIITRHTFTPPNDDTYFDLQLLHEVQPIVDEAKRLRDQGDPEGVLGQMQKIIAKTEEIQARKEQFKNPFS